MEGAPTYTAATVVALFLIDDQPAVHKACSFDRTGCLDLTLFTTLTLLGVVLRDPCTNDANVIQIGFDTVIGAAAHSDFELVGEGNTPITLIETFMDFIAQRISIVQAVLACCAFAGNHRANLASGTAGFQADPSQAGAKRINILVIDPGNFNRQAGGHHHISIAIELGSFGNGSALLVGNAAIAGDNAAIKLVCALML